MKTTLKGILFGFLTAAICFSSIIYAASRTKTTAFSYENIKVYKDNVLCELIDANGATIEPFIYNGTTYMPVRGTANLVGLDVTWDGATKSIYLWDKMVPDHTELIEGCPPYETKNHFMSGEKIHEWFNSIRLFFK